jgi:hypothetical protein
LIIEADAGGLLVGIRPFGQDRVNECGAGAGDLGGGDGCNRCGEEAGDRDGSQMFHGAFLLLRGLRQGLPTLAGSTFPGRFRRLAFLCCGTWFSRLLEAIDELTAGLIEGGNRPRLYDRHV